MERFSRKAIWVMMGVCLLWMPAINSFGAELIEPTRVLEDDNQKSGQLSVFSEPPGLGVTLDGKAIGKTPLILKSVAQGTHVLRVEKKETIITIGPGEVRRLSFFKDAFVEIPAEEKVSRVAPMSAGDQAVQASGSEQPPEKSQKLEPGYFPLNPRGRIY